MVPALTPVSTPLGDTVAIERLPLLHEPPGVTSLNCCVTPPTTTHCVPVIPDGVGLTVTIIVQNAFAAPSEALILKESIPLKPGAGVYVNEPGGVTDAPVGAVTGKPDNVPCAGAVLTVHVAVSPVAGSDVVNKELIDIGPEFWQAFGIVRGLPPV